MATVLDRVIKVVENEIADGAPVTSATNFADDLAADSLDLVELMMALEVEFEVNGKKLEIPDNDAERINTVQDAVDYLKSLGFSD